MAIDCRGALVVVFSAWNSFANHHFIFNEMTGGVKQFFFSIRKAFKSVPSANIDTQGSDEGHVSDWNLSSPVSGRVSGSE